MGIIDGIRNTGPISSAHSRQSRASQQAAGSNTKASRASMRKAFSPQPARRPCREYPAACLKRLKPLRALWGLTCKKASDAGSWCASCEGADSCRGRGASGSVMAQVNGQKGVSKVQVYQRALCVLTGGGDAVSAGATYLASTLPEHGWRKPSL